jgi:two-component sensor histidine kinase
VAELVANAAKHGAGRIRVSLERASPSEYALSVSDEGAGLPAGYNPANTSGLGMRVISTLLIRPSSSW